VADSLPLSALDAALGPLAEAALTACDGVLARVWLTGPGDACSSCALRAECPERRRCLHLVASAGLTGRIDGPFRRFPIGARQVGRVPVTREPFVATEALDALGLAERTWLTTHAVASFAAVPLPYGGDCIGVVAVFSREARFRTGTLTAVAQLGGVALGNVRAFRDLAGERNRLAARAPRGAAEAALRPLQESEREILARALAHTGGRVSGPRGAAAILGLKPTTLFSRMKKLGVRRRPS
jgi:transcriptional regulator with GAF, ATPase, and Fis domain